MSIFIEKFAFSCGYLKKTFFVRFRAPLIFFHSSFILFLVVVIYFKEKKFSCCNHPFSCGLKQFSCVIHIYPSNYSTKQKIEFKHVIFCKQFVVLYLITDFLSSLIYSLIIDLDQKDHYKYFGQILIHLKFLRVHCVYSNLKYSNRILFSLTIQ